MRSWRSWKRTRSVECRWLMRADAAAASSRRPTWPWSPAKAKWARWFAKCRAIRWTQGLTAERNQVGGFLADHHARRVGGGIHHLRHDRRVGHTQSVDAADAK